MTNKPMLSVEPIKLVAILASELAEWPEGCDELFQTSSGRVIGISSTDDEVSEKIGTFTMNSEGNDPYVTRAEFESAKAEITQKLAAQHQGEPVAWMACGQLFKTVMGARNYAGSLPITPLFAEQPAPVAVMMPEDWEDQLFAEMSRRFDLRKQIDDDHMVYDDTQIGVEFARDWIKARLNEVKP